MPQIIPPFYGEEYDEFGRRIIRPMPASPPLPTMTPEMIPQQNLQQASLPLFSQMQPPAAPAPHIQMAPPSPAMMENIVPPRMEDYQPGRLRTVMNAIAGGLAGAAGGPQVGFQTGQALHDIPFNRAMQSYEVKTADQARRLAIEKERQRQAEFATSAATREEAVSSAVADKAENLKLKQADEERKKGELDRKKADDASKAAARQSRIDFLKFQQANPKADKLQYLLSAKTPEEREARLETLREFTEATTTPKPTDEEAASKAGAVREAQLKKEMQFGVPLAGSKTKTTEQAKIDVTTAPENVKKVAELTRAKSIANITSDEKNTIRSAQHALGAFPDIESQLTTASDKIFGNRWNEFMTGTLGNDPEFAPLRVNIGMLQTLVAKLHVGSRGSVHILNHFQTLFNAKQMDRATLAAALPELKKWLVRYSKMPSGTAPDDVPESDVTKTPRPPILLNGKPVN